MKSTIQIIFLVIFLIGAFYIGSYHGSKQEQIKNQVAVQNQQEQLDSLQAIVTQERVKGEKEIKVLKDSLKSLYEEMEGLVGGRR